MTKILLVDDDIDFLTQTELRLRADGYDVVTAEGEEEAASSSISTPRRCNIVKSSQVSAAT